MKFFGHDFRDESLLEEALTTPSFRMTTPGARDNQRLEFLGDSVLGFLAADRLYREDADIHEGGLTIRRTHMVSTLALCAAASRLSLAGRLRRNKGAGVLPANSKTLADAVEAIVGAAWLDGGLEAAREVFETLALDENAESGGWADNPKGTLQILAQSMTPPHRPVYTLLRVDGPAHEPVFTVKVSVTGMGEAVAEAATRKDAESRAAAKLLDEGKAK